jgi:ribosomal protein S18 acetylase RimI-like enzyme
MASALGGRSQSDTDAAYADPASAFHYDNAVVLLRPPVAIEEVVRRAYEFYPQRRPWALLSLFPLGDLSPMGLTLDGHPPLMVRPPGAATPAPVDGLSIEPVRSAEQIADFDRVLVAGYPGISAGGSIANPALLEAGVARLFLGYLDGKPVATSGSAVNHGIVEVDWVCTLPDLRGRGIGAAMTHSATTVDPMLPAVLIASDEGRSVYERLGYLSLQRATLWTRVPDWSRPL